jgi:hypothetical protein
MPGLAKSEGHEQPATSRKSPERRKSARPLNRKGAGCVSLRPAKSGTRLFLVLLYSVAVPPSKNNTYAQITEHAVSIFLSLYQPSVAQLWRYIVLVLPTAVL